MCAIDTKNALFSDDGDEDVVVAANVGPAVFYENVGGNKKNWLRIQVVHRLIFHVFRMGWKLMLRPNL